MGRKKKNQVVIHDYYFPNYDDSTFKDRLVRANEYLVSLGENPIDGLEYDGHRSKPKRKYPKFNNIRVTSTPEIIEALSGYTESSSKTNSARRNRFLPLLAIAFSIFALLISQHALDWLPPELRAGGYPYVGVGIFVLIGWFIDKYISIPDEKHSQTLAVVTAIRKLRKAADPSASSENQKFLWHSFISRLHR